MKFIILSSLAVSLYLGAWLLIMRSNAWFIPCPKCHKRLTGFIDRLSNYIIDDQTTYPQEKPPFHLCYRCGHIWKPTR